MGPGATIFDSYTSPGWLASSSGGMADEHCHQVCGAIAKTLNQTALQADELGDSSLSATLLLQGLLSMYLFCLAVLISLSTSVYIDRLDDGLRETLERQQDAAAAARAKIREKHPLAGADPLGRPPSKRALAVVGEHTEDDVFDDDPESDAAVTRALGGRAARLHALAVAVQLSLTVASFTFPIVHRQIEGSVGTLLRAHGLDFDGSFSLLGLGSLVSRGGVGGPTGGDPAPVGTALMTTTYLAFIVVCPVLRGATQLALLLLPLSAARKRRLHGLSRFVSYYYGNEVMLVAVPLLHLAFKPMTATILSHHTAPWLCPDGQSCFAIDVKAASGFYLCARRPRLPPHRIRRVAHAQVRAPRAPPARWVAAAGLRRVR